MSAKFQITLDVNNLFAPAIADGPDSFDSGRAKIREIAQGLSALRSTGQLGFSRQPFDDKLHAEVAALASRYHGVKHIVVFGIGGSALGAKSIHLALSGPLSQLRPLGKKLLVIDNVDPATLLELAAIVRDDALFVFVSKSGNTAETLAQYLFAEKFVPKLNADNAVVITDPRSGCLREIALKKEIPILPIPSGVGGRFSVFTPAGLLPLAAAGVDVASLLEGARQAEKCCQSEDPESNPAAAFAFALDGWCRKGLTQLVLMPYSDRLALFTDWASQLLAESLNKKATLAGGTPPYGLTPIKALGAVDQHSQLQLYLDGPRDKVVCFLDVRHGPVAPLAAATLQDERLDFLSEKSLGELLHAEKLATEESLRENARPNMTVTLDELTPLVLGQLYQTFMNVVPYLGGLQGINPYDQPAVERIKKFTFGLMGKSGYGDFTQKIAERPRRDDLVL